MSEYIIEKLKCEDVETLRGWLENPQMTGAYLTRKSAEAIVQDFDQRNAEILWRKNEMQVMIDAGQKAADIEHARQHIPTTNDAVRDLPHKPDQT